METKKNIIESIFIPENYREPSSSDNYLKLKQGENKIRIMSSMVMGWEDWTVEERPKPIRFRYEQKPLSPLNAQRPIKMFWAFAVWNYTEKKIQILYVTQSSIRRQIAKIANDGDWGNPMNYDLKITKTGEDLNTIYAVVPVPHSSTPVAATKAFNEMSIKLDALFQGEDPFDTFSAFTPPKVEKGA